MTSSLTLSTNVPVGLPDLAFTGKAGAGKTTATGLLMQVGYRRLAFADRMRDAVELIWGKQYRNDRTKIQAVATTSRALDDYAWIRPVLSIIDSRDPEHKLPYAVEDARMEAEWWALQARNFVIVRVEAPRHSRINRLRDNGKWQGGAEIEHVSEWDADHLTPDYTVINDGTTMDLADQLLAVINTERKKR